MERRDVWRADRVDVRLRQGRLDPHHLRALAAELARAYAASPAPEIARDGSAAQALVAHVRTLGARLADTLPHEPAVGGLRARLEHVPADLVEQRIPRGRLALGPAECALAALYVDAAGVATLATPAPDRAPRAADVALGVARVAVALAAERRRDLAECFVAAWADVADDYDLYRVLTIFEAVAALELAADAIDRGDASAAVRCIAAVRDGTPPSRPRLVAVAGPIASGKSTVATRLAAEIGAPVLCAEATRDALVARGAKAIDGWSIHLELTRRAEAVLDSGRSVVLDGGFRSHAMRRAAARLARDRGVAFLFTECRAREATLRRRLAERWERGDFEEACEDLLADWEPVGALDGAAHVVIDTTQAAPRGFARLRRALPAANPLVA